MYLELHLDLYGVEYLVERNNEFHFHNIYFEPESISKLIIDNFQEKEKLKYDENKNTKIFVFIEYKHRYTVVNLLKFY